MADENPGLTWAALKSWADETGIPGDALMTDPDGRPVRGLYFAAAGQSGPGSPAVFRIQPYRVLR